MLSIIGQNSIFATDLNPSLSAACQLADQSFGICSCTEPDYLRVLELCLAHGIKLVIPTIDTELQALSESVMLLLPQAYSLLL